jgi:Subtilase family
VNSLNITAHATEVAGVMIGKAGDVHEGVAPNANLYSIGFSGDDGFAAEALNRIATFTGTNAQGKPIRMRAINISIAREGTPGIDLQDGQEYLSQFIDWSTSHQDMTYSVAWGDQNSFPIRIPQDNYNGIKVAASEKPVINGRQENVFRQFSQHNAMDGDPAGDRSGIDLLAPGADVQILGQGDQPLSVSGSSQAAPHVTAAVSLLQQYARNQMELPTPNPRFTSHSQHHEVMKAVLLNSADKLAGVHDSTRDVIDLNGNKWTQLPASADDATPLDARLGAGEVNVKSAVKQFAPGEYDPGNVPSLGWDFDNVGGQGSRNEYILNQGGSGYIAVTLIWDRRVESSRPGNTYQSGDQFFQFDSISEVLNNLNVYVLPVNDNNLGDAVAKSIASEDNVEHIFKDIPAGNYKIVVTNEAGGIGDDQDYGIAWWFGSGAGLTPQGDYNHNGSVGPEDYMVWKTNFGSSSQLDADGNGNGIVDAADYTIWRDRLGQTVSGTGSAAAVPEPSGLALLAVAGMVLGWRRSIP